MKLIIYSQILYKCTFKWFTTADHAIAVLHYATLCTQTVFMGSLKFIASPRLMEMKMCKLKVLKFSGEIQTISVSIHTIYHFIKTNNLIVSFSLFMLKTKAYYVLIFMAISTIALKVEIKNLT